jgi:hypothetical protein
MIGLRGENQRLLAVRRTVFGNGLLVRMTVWWFQRLCGRMRLSQFHRAYFVRCIPIVEQWQYEHELDLG